MYTVIERRYGLYQLQERIYWWVEEEEDEEEEKEEEEEEEYNLLFNLYTGNRCDHCLDGFYGNPRGVGGPATECQRCACNNNIDNYAIRNCDRSDI